ncbi:MAG: glycosyltransferase [Candidatus Peregrinibacteria bacterium]
MPSLVLLFGAFPIEAPRTHCIRAAFEGKGNQCVLCHTEAPGFFRKCLDLVRTYRLLKQDAHTVVVLFPGHHLMPLAWLLTCFPRRRLVFDAFISVHDTLVSDRRLVARWSPKALFLWIVDFVSCHLADEVILDTEAHRQFFVRAFHLKPERVRVIYLTARHDLFRPCPRTIKFRLPSPPQKGEKMDEGGKREIMETMDVFFFGSFIPLQGISVILHAAKMLASRTDIYFSLLGSGQTYGAMRKLAEELELPNVTFEPWMDLEKLPERICRADICLGIFGTSAKAARVIPHKVYEAVACGKPVITMRSPAILEKFQDGREVILCEAGNPEDLAKKILELTEKLFHLRP